MIVQQIKIKVAFYHLKEKQRIKTQEEINSGIGFLREIKHTKLYLQINLMKIRSKTYS